MPMSGRETSTDEGAVPARVTLESAPELPRAEPELPPQPEQAQSTSNHDIHVNDVSAPSSDANGLLPLLGRQTRLTN